MKKAYETPIVEKIAFNYRDQVVAASGDSENNVSGGSGRFTLAGGSFCSVVDWVAREWGDSRLCNWFW